MELMLGLMEVPEKVRGFPSAAFQSGTIVPNRNPLPSSGALTPQALKLPRS